MCRRTSTESKAGRGLVTQGCVGQGARRPRQLTVAPLLILLVEAGGADPGEGSSCTVLSEVESTCSLSAAPHKGTWDRSEGSSCSRQEVGDPCFHLSCIFSRIGTIISNLGRLAGSSFMQIFISLQIWGEMPGGMVGRSPSRATWQGNRKQNRRACGEQR